MRKSPYRDYLDGELHDEGEIVYLKVIAEDEKLLEIEEHLYHVMPRSALRAVRRRQAGAPGISGLYIYAHTATMEQAEKRLMQMLREEEPELRPVEIRLKTPYISERDAMQVLYMLGNEYEPVSFFGRSSKKSS